VFTATHAAATIAGGLLVAIEGSPGAVLPVNSSRHASGSLLFTSAPPLQRRIVLRRLRWRRHRMPQVQHCLQNDVFRGTGVAFPAVKQQAGSRRTKLVA